LYYYVGREWALRGRIPYRDVFDHKTPGIYAVHALCVKVFGEGLWGIRVAEILAVAALGYASALAATPRGRAYRGPLAGYVALATSATYFGSFDFREIAEGELWVCLFVAAAAAALSRVRNATASAGVAGAFWGASLMMKPSALWFLLPLLVQAYANQVLPIDLTSPLRSLKAWALRATAFSVGTAAVPGAALAYFGAHGALRDAYEIVILANATYVKQESAIQKKSDIVWFTGMFADQMQPTPTVVGLAMVALFLGRRRLPDGVWAASTPLAFLLAAWVSVVTQGKFFPGHWSVLLVAVALTTAFFVRSFRSLRPRTSAFLLVAAMVLPAAFSAWRLRRYIDLNETASEYVRGKVTRREYVNSRFVEHAVAAAAVENEDVADFLRTHTRPEENVLVRGFQPQIYARAERYWRGRFFWSTFLVAETRTYNREKWLAEDQADLERVPPDVVVTLRWGAEMDSPRPWLAKGYQEIFGTGDLVVMERPNRK
jgi:hypothetical protein